MGSPVVAGLRALLERHPDRPTRDVMAVVRVYWGRHPEDQALAVDDLLDAMRQKDAPAYRAVMAHGLPVALTAVRCARRDPRGR